MICIKTDIEKCAKRKIFVLFALGTRGDVQPMIALGVELSKRGHTVVICASLEFEQLVKSFNLQFHTCGVDSMANQESTWMQAKTQSDFLAAIAQTWVTKLGIFGQHLLQCCELYQADCIISGVYGIHTALDIAEAKKYKVWAIKYFPAGVTRYHPPFGTIISKESIWNVILHYKQLIKLGLAFHRCQYTKLQNNFRKEFLNLGPVTRERLESGGKYLPTLFAYSTILAPRAQDWPPWHQCFGFFFTAPTTKENNVLSPQIQAFLREEKVGKIICITFGSMNSLKDCNIVENLVFVCLKLGFRVIIISSWTEFELNEEHREKCLIISSVQHELLFPYCSLVIHHGGAGTTARVAQSGVPSVIIPILSWLDQKGWALAIEKYGCGIYVDDPFISRENLEKVIYRVVLDPVDSLLFAASARSLSRRMKKIEENSVQNAVDYLLSSVESIPFPSDKFSLESVKRMVARSCLHCS